MVQRFAQRELDIRAEALLERLALTGEEAQEARGLIASRRAEIELAGMRAFDQLRVRAGDRVSFEWRGTVILAMLARLEELVGDDGEEDEGQAGVPVCEPIRPRPGGGHALAERGRGMRSREELYLVALRLAQRHVSRIVGGCSGSPVAVEDLIQEAAHRGAERCERRWEPDRASLLGWLSVCVKWVALAEYRKFVEGKALDEKLRELTTGALLSQERGHSHAEDVADRLWYEAMHERLPGWLERLCPTQRAAVAHRLAGGAPAKTGPEQQVLKRAYAKLREFAAEADGGAAHDTAGADAAA